MKRLLVLVAVLFAMPSAQAAIKPQTFMVCGSLLAPDREQHPSRCFLDWPDLSLADAIDLHAIHWSNWGARVATARARTRVKTNEPWTYVRVRAFRRKDCPFDLQAYSRVRVSFPGGRSHVWRLVGCGDLSTP